MIHDSESWCKLTFDEDDQESVREVYRELRRLAQQQMSKEALGHSLQATALVHEAYLRLHEHRSEWNSDAHFFAAAVEAMRRILVDHARAKKTFKRGRNWKRVAFYDPPLRQSEIDLDEFLDFDELLSVLYDREPRVARLVKLRMFAGLSVSDAAKVLGVSRSVAYENWAFARCWFDARLAESHETGV
ncbi:ECF sigma factor [Stieleria maiorica]|uniref:ECF sigma factor n=1 Tax=Stieleria maiorica TaxID=2795974 RepID=A0A5B9MKI4_9BACT|nr:ECF-type sigma factor [Stieleria maiorica]QEG00531.1 ECF sigma factor [Stieleria maiorica]